ncbi:hypothetical protein N1851_006049 [Merluccius polli]|uniref:Uncharacterized protein n=1 Tax=Merluccius polli TaxID=89951 RepID=A0AA47N5X0_MERPO|nr:hypothetical protein N1851_006049 [Merluccius polli]
MKQLYRVDIVKEARLQYVQLKGHITYIFLCGFNLSKVRRCGRNIIGQRTTGTLPGQRGANITMCAAISNNGALCHKPTISRYDTERLVTFLDALNDWFHPKREGC